LSSLLATPSPTRPPVSPADVRSAVQAFVAGLNTAFRTGDARAATAASTAQCTCRAQLAAIARAYAHHAHFDGTHLVIGRIVLTRRDASVGQAKVSVRVPASALVLSNGKRKPLKAFAPRTVTATVVEHNGQWVVSSFTGLPRPEVTASATPSPHG
jgi:hypothetical protein